MRPLHTMTLRRAFLVFATGRGLGISPETAMVQVGRDRLTHCSRRLPATRTEWCRSMIPGKSWLSLPSKLLRPETGALGAAGLVGLS